MRTASPAGAIRGAAVVFPVHDTGRAAGVFSAGAGTLHDRASVRRP